MEPKLTDAQLRVLREMVEGEHQYVMHETRFGQSQKNRPAWKLVELGYAEFDFGPKGSFLQMYGFMPTQAGFARYRKEHGIS